MLCNCYKLASVVSPLKGGGWKTLYSTHARMWYIYSVYIFSYIHNPGVHGRFYGLDLNENGHLGKPVVDMLDSSMMKKTAADSKP